MRFSFAALIVAAGAVPAFAPAFHHSFAAQYDGTKPVRLVGPLVKVEWANPHSYFYVTVVGPDGKEQTWAGEGAGPGALSRRGLKRGDLKIGDTLVVDGYRARSGANLVDARRVTLPDGRNIYGGTPGDGGPPDAGVWSGPDPLPAWPPDSAGAKIPPKRPTAAPRRP